MVERLKEMSAGSGAAWEGLGEVSFTGERPSRAEIFRMASEQNSSVGYVEQELGRASLAKIMERVQACTPSPELFAKDEGRDETRCRHAAHVEKAIKERFERRTRLKTPDELDEDFYNRAFEALVYGFALEGAFSADRKPAKMLVSSDFDDFINVGRTESPYYRAPQIEVAHAIDCAISVPYEATGKDGRKKTVYMPIAFACTTAAEDGRNSSDGRSTAAAKMAKYPENGFARLEFAVDGETGEHCKEMDLPCFVLGMDRGSLRDMGTKGDFRASEKLRVSFAAQIVTQVAARLNYFRGLSADSEGHIDMAGLSPQDASYCKRMQKVGRYFQKILSETNISRTPTDHCALLVVRAARQMGGARTGAWR